MLQLINRINGEAFTEHDHELLQAFSALRLSKLPADQHPSMPLPKLPQLPSSAPGAVDGRLSR